MSLTFSAAHSSTAQQHSSSSTAQQRRKQQRQMAAASKQNRACCAVDVAELSADWLVACVPGTPFAMAAVTVCVR